MSVLAAWLRRWQPVAIHSTMHLEARPDAVGGTVGDTLDCWHKWALHQQDFIVGGKARCLSRGLRCGGQPLRSARHRLE